MRYNPHPFQINHGGSLAATSIFLKTPKSPDQTFLLNEGRTVTMFSRPGHCGMNARKGRQWPVFDEVFEVSWRSLVDVLLMFVWVAGCFFGPPQKFLTSSNTNCRWCITLRCVCHLSPVGVPGSNNAREHAPIVAQHEINLSPPSVFTGFAPDCKA